MGVPRRASDHATGTSVETRIQRLSALLVVAVQVYVLLVLARLVILVLPMRRITARLGHQMQETAHDDLDERERHYATRVGVMILRLARFTPTNSNCYPQALTAWWLLARRGIPTTYYYGARFQPDGSGLDAHVWLRSGTVIVTGGRVGPYKALTSYAADRAFLRRIAKRRYRGAARGSA